MSPRLLVSRLPAAQFLVEETAVEGPGEGPVFDREAFDGHPFILTLGITHALEQQSLELDLLGSDDGVTWHSRPFFSFPPKYYCGTYEASLSHLPHRYIKPVWCANRWARGGDKPFFRLYLHAEPVRHRAMAGAA